MEDKKFTEIKHVAAVHDLCGYGNCSLGVAIPVLSVAGIEVCAVPTAILAAHTAFPIYSFLDTTPELPEYLRVWDEIPIPLDGIYSGFLGSAKQMDILMDYFNRHPELPLFLDPVMGDHGEIYKTYTPEMCKKMRKLTERAKILTPNMTEASILLDFDYPGQKLSSEEAEEILDALLEMGPSFVVLKGIERPGGFIVNAFKGKDSPYEERKNPLRPYALHGTGDLFASIMAGGYFTGKNLADCVELAGSFVAEAIDLSIHQEGFQTRGISFEPMLGQLARSYEEME